LRYPSILIGFPFFCRIKILNYDWFFETSSWEVHSYFSSFFLKSFFFSFLLASEQEDYDVIVIGSGTGGSSFVRSLCEHSENFVILWIEAGPILKEKEEKKNRRGKNQETR
jgi:hypothetical protein